MGKNNYQAGMPGSIGQRLTKRLQDLFIEKEKTMPMPTERQAMQMFRSALGGGQMPPESGAAPAQSAWHNMPADPAEGQMMQDPSGMAAQQLTPGQAAARQPASAYEKNPPAQPGLDLKKLSDADLQNMAAGGVEAAADELMARQSQ